MPPGPAPGPGLATSDVRGEDADAVPVQSPRARPGGALEQVNSVTGTAVGKKTWVFKGFLNQEQWEDDAYISGW